MEPDALTFALLELRSEEVRSIGTFLGHKGFGQNAILELELQHLEPAAFPLPSDLPNDQVAERKVLVLFAEVDDIFSRGPVEAVATE